MTYPGWGYPILTWQGGYPIMSWLGATSSWLGVLHPVLAGGGGGMSWDQSLGYPPRKDMGPVEVLWDGDRVHPPLPSGGQSEYITSRRTTYAGGNKGKLVSGSCMEPGFQYQLNQA